MNITRINKYRDGGSMSFEYEDGHTIWIKGVGIDASQFFDDDPSHKVANKLRMSNKDIHSLIADIHIYYQQKIRQNKQYTQSAERWKDFKPGDMK